MQPSKEQQGFSHEEGHVQGAVAGGEGVVDLSLWRVGIYIGESSRTLAERTSEHFHDADSFSKKSHIIKHWIISPGEMETMPPYKMTIRGRMTE